MLWISGYSSGTRGVLEHDSVQQVEVPRRKVLLDLLESNHRRRVLNYTQHKPDDRDKDINQTLT